VGVVAARDGGAGAPRPTSATDATAALSERAFLDLMIPHHEMALRMARIAMRHRGDLALVEVARDIIAEQTWEIRLMTRWRKQWFGATGSATLVTPADAGMMGMGADMSALQRARPFAPTFYVDMIPHHAGAIVMAQRLLLGHPRPALARLARTIIDGQSRDIAKMERYRQIALGRVSAQTGPTRAPTGGPALP
jgi:uncharacterized protein (DUF305 family)